MKTIMMGRWRRLLTTIGLFGLLGAACDDTASGGGLPNPGQPDAGLVALSFVAPTSDSELGIDDDDDGDLSNGLQYEVQVALTGLTTFPEDVAITLTVDGGTPLTSTVETQGADAGGMDAPTGIANFPVTFEEPGEHRLEASAEIDGVTLRDEVIVVVAVAQCSLTVTPAPSGGTCDLGPEADLDPELDGIQTVLTAETDCARVSFVVNNLPAIEVAVVDGVATTEVTLRDGNNTVQVTAAGGGGSANQVGPYPLAVSAAAPRIELDDMSAARENIHLLADGVSQEGRTYWELSGSTSGLAGGSVVSLDFAPAIGGAPATAIVDESGNFSFELSLAEQVFYTGTLTVRGTDACGVTGASSTYRVRFDSVTSRLRIDGPADGSLIALLDDIGPNRAGVQIPISVAVTDPRPEEIDYRLTVECAPVSNEPVFVDRTREASDPVQRSHLSDLDPNNDQVIATFTVTESGEYICRAAATGDINPPESIAVAWRVFFRRPTFTVLSPQALPGCNTGDEVEISGFGEQLEGNDPSLQVVITPDGGEPLPAVSLNPLGQQRYGRSFNGEQLAEGLYRVEVSGNVFDRVPIDILPGPVDMVVDRTPPTVRFLSPSIDGELLDEDPATQGTQVRVRVEVCGAPGETLTVGTNPVVGPAAQGIVPADGECGIVELPALTVPLGSIEFTAQVMDTCGFEAVERQSAAIPDEDVLVRVVQPANGANINVASDSDAARPGCQFEVQTLSRGFTEDNPLAVCTDDNQGLQDPLCGAGSSALDSGCNSIGSSPEGTAFLCTVSLPAGRHALTFVRRARGETVSSPAVQVLADCSAPSVAGVTVAEDGDSNGCIHRQERRNAADGGDNARVTVRFSTDGMEDGDAVRVRLDDGSPGGADLGGGVVADDAGEVQVTLPPGTHRLFLRGRDQVGNALPEPGEPGGPEYAVIRVDTTPPTPNVLNLVPDSCLNAGDDIDTDTANLQYALQVETGRDGDELVTGQLTVDGVLVSETTDAVDRFDFPALTLGEGDRQIRALVTDTCGNIGSVAGFDNINGQPNWTRPLPISTRVDSIAPGLTLGGIANGQTLAPGDDADGDSTNGFQTNATVAVAAGAGLEQGQSIVILSNDAPVSTTPDPLSATGGTDPIAVQLTIPPGRQDIVARATDQCGNTGTSSPVNVEVQVEGCLSQITNLPGATTILGASDGDIQGDTLSIEVQGIVELLDEQCLGANVELIVDNEVVQRGVVGNGGAVSFPGTVLARGPGSVRLRVGPVRGNTVESANEQVLVDLASPTVRITQPADGEVVLTDSSALPGQQITVRAEIIEAGVDSARTATITLDGIAIGDPIEVGSEEVAPVNFVDVTVPPGNHTVEVCALDAAGSSGCAQREFVSDPSAPGAVGGLTATIVDRRSTEVRFDFTAPGDDGNTGGAVVEFEVRSAGAALDEVAWDNAADNGLTIPAQTGPGEATQITLSGTGPGPNLADGLGLNQRHFVAIRARDDVGQLGPIVNVEADLTFNQASFQMNPAGGNWADGGLVNPSSPVVGLGDINQDGYDDVLVTAVQLAGQSQAAVILGADDPQDGSLVLLDAPAGRNLFGFGISSAATGDVNGDNIPDFAVQGLAPDFSRTEVAVFFGCNQCAAAEIAAPDALIVTSALTQIIMGAGEFSRPAGDQVAYSDIVLGGNLVSGRAYVVAGRNDWPDWGAGETLDISEELPAGDRVTAIVVPEGRAAVYGTGAGDLNGDGFSEFVFSAGVAINVVYVFNGGADLGDVINYAGADPATRALPDPCPADNPSFGSFFAGGVDLNGDAGNQPDFVVGNRNNKRLAVFDNDLNDLDCFARGPTQFGKIFDLAGDVDGDGAIDLVVTHEEDQNVNAFVFYNDGSGQFGIGAEIPQRGHHVLLDTPAVRKQGVAGIGDFDNDGRADIGAVIKQAGNGPIEFVVYY